MGTYRSAELESKPGIATRREGRFYVLTNHWTGLLDWTVSCTVSTTKIKAIVSPHLKQCPSVGHLVQCNLSIVATPRHQTNCRGALGR